MQNNLAKKKELLLDLREGDTVKALPDSGLHFMSHHCLRGFAESKLSSTPILLNKVELAMIFRIKITQMAMQLNSFFEQ